jgi:Protein of unknown function (DUF3275)
MILLSGTLQMSTPSAHAVLRCDLGAFSVLDERLASVSAGDHDGLFEIEHIKPHQLPSPDGVIQLGVIAVLKRFSLTLLDQPVKTVAKKARRSSVNSAQCSLFAEEEAISPSDTESTEHADQITDTVLPDEPISVMAAAVIADEATLVPAKTESSVDRRAAVNTSDQKPLVNTVIALTDSDRALFGDRFELLETITLESTESRDVLRRQRDRLIQLGYRFDAANQIWRQACVSASTAQG